MASLLDRLKKNIAGAAKGAVNTASRAYDQVNILDNGRSYQTRTPTTNQSVVQQATNQVVKPIIKPVVQVANTGKALVGGTIGLGRVGAASVLGSDRDYANELRGVTNTLNRDLGGNTGLLGMGTIFKDAQEAQNITPRQLAGKSIAYGSQIASLATPQVKGLTVAGKAIPNLLSRPATNAVVGASGSAGGQYAETGKIDPKAVARDAAISALLGEAPGAAKAISKQAVPLAKKGTQVAVKANEKAFTPRVSVQDQNVLRDFSDLQAGTYSPTPDARGSLIAQARQVGAKYGVDLNSGNPRDLLDKTNSVLDQVGQRNKAMAQGGYVGNVPGDENLESIVQNGNTRPAAEIQTAIERAHNAGDNEAVAQLITQLPEDMQSSMRGVFNLPEPKGTQRGRSERGFTQTVANNENTSPAVSIGINARDNTYRARSTKSLQTKAANLVSDDENAALNLVRNGSDDKAVATASELIKKYQDAGNFERAIDIAEQIAPKLTEAGRAAQAASIYGRLTPTGALRFTQRQLDKYNQDSGLTRNGVQAGGRSPAKLSPERAKQITELSKQIQKMPEGEQKVMAIGKLTDLMNSAAPTPAMTKLANIWRAGLLTSLRTLEGGVIGNASKAALDIPSNAIAAGLDKFVTAPLLNKGVRSNAFTLGGRGSGFVEGTKRGAQYLKTGVDPRDVGRGYDTKQMNLEDGNRILNAGGKAAEKVYRAMGAVDNPFYYSGLRNAEREQSILARKNAGKAGAPTEDIAQERAIEQAREGVFQNDTSLGTIAAQLKNAPQKIKDPQSRAAAQAVIDFTVPFVKIPSAVATALVDYSPAGFIATAAKQGFRRELDVRKLNTAIGKSATGSIGAVFVGSQLYNKGLLTLEAPQDKNEKQLWDLEKKQPFSIKIGGKWRKLNYVQPIGSLMAVGGGYARAKDSGESNPIIAASAAGLKAVSDQSFLKGISGAISAVQDSERSAQTFANSTIGSFVPNIVKDLARATDSKERETNSITDALKAGIPGARGTLLPQRDPFGNEVQRKQSPAGVFLDPFKSTTDTTNPVTSEIRRIYELDRSDPNNKVAPTKLTKQQTFAGQKAVLSPKQLDQFEATVGPAAYSKIDQIIKTNDYKNASDKDKANTIQNIISETRSGSKPDFAAANVLKDKRGNVLAIDDKKFKKVSTTTQVSSGSTASRSKLGDDVPDNTPDYAKQWINKYKDLDSKQLDDIKYKEPAAEFEYEAAKFEKDLASGKVKKADEIKTRSKLQKLEAGKDTPREIRDLYSLNKTQVYQLITTDPDGNTIAQMLLDYGDKLEGATGTKNKFKTKYGDVDFDPATASTSGTKKKSSGSKKGGGSSKTFQVPGNANPFGSILSATNTAANAASKVSIKAKKPTKRRRVS